MTVLELTAKGRAFRRSTDRLTQILLIACVLPMACSAPVTEAFQRHEREGVTWLLNRGPGTWGDGGEPPVTFVLEQIFGVDLTPVQAVLGSIDGIDVDHDGNVYILDGQSNELVAFSTAGIVLWRVGSRGQGPGEFQRPLGIALDDNGSIVVSNQSGTVLDRFDVMTGMFRNRRRVMEAGIARFFIDGFLAPDLILGHDRIPGAIGTRLLVLRQGAQLALAAAREIDVDPEVQVPADVSMTVAVRASDGKILVGHDGRYEIRILDHSLQLVQVIARPDVGHLVRTGFTVGDGGRGFFARMGWVGPPVVFPDGMWLVSASWPTGVSDPDAWIRKLVLEPGSPPERGPPGRSLDFFEADGRYLGGFQWVGDSGPEIGLPVLVAADGKLYTERSDPFPQLRRYRVMIRAME